MNFIIKNIKWVMLVSGVLTFIMFYGLFAPKAALELMFGASFNGSLENIVIRSWSALERGSPNKTDGLLLTIIKFSSYSVLSKPTP
jgi:hypothetical protein